jgi:hypothetical protein
LAIDKRHYHKQATGDLSRPSVSLKPISIIHQQPTDMRLLPFFLCVFAFSALGAQDTDVAADYDGPVFAYKAETTTQPLANHGPGDRNGKNSRRNRERTLLGDLDLSGIWAGPTYNYTSTGNDWALMRGGFGGLEFSNEFFIGYGGWSNREDFTVDEPDANSPVFNFRHSGLILAYTPFSDNAIHPRITGVFGPGRFELLDDSNQPVADDRSDRFLVGQATIGVELNLFQWFRLGIDGGYRFASGIQNLNVTDQDLSGTFVQLEARFGFSW